MPATTKTSITQLKDMNAERVDGVTDPANGFPILMLKAVAEPAEPEAQTTGCGCCEDCTAGVAKADADTEKAKEPGVPEPVKDEAVKDAEEPGTQKPEADAPPAAVEKTAEPEEAGDKDETADLVKSLAEKLEGQEGVIKGLQAELKRLSDTPIPGTPFVMAPAAGNGKAEAFSKAAYFKDLADKVRDPELASYYRSQAAALAGN